MSIVTWSVSSPRLGEKFSWPEVALGDEAVSVFGVGGDPPLRFFLGVCQAIQEPCTEQPLTDVAVGGLTARLRRG